MWGRTAYADRVKAILLAATSKSVAAALAADLHGYETGKLHDETSWLDVALHACRILNAAEKVVFLTAWEIASAPAYVERATADGYRIVAVPDELRRKLGGATDIAGNPIVDLGMFSQRWNESFTFALVDEKDLNEPERAVFARTRDVIALQGAYPRQIKAVLISGRCASTQGVPLKWSGTGTLRPVAWSSGATSSGPCQGTQELCCMK